MKKNRNQNKLLEIEQHFDSDVFSYFGPIVDGNENIVLEIIKKLSFIL